jgi:phospholipase D1/2
VSATTTGARLLAPGRNCWRLEHADRIAFLVDAAAYFASVRSAVAQAQRCVFIIGWDFDSRIRLVPAGAGDGLPEDLGPFLREVVHRRRGLHVYVLSWDFVFLFAGNREWVPLYKLGWRTHPRPRISFRLDGKHPVTGSHHQKVVVVDDAVAFVGGLDLTHGRWDTPAHRAREPYRVDMYGRQARPNHDVQAIVDGPAAIALGDLCRERWQRATGQRVKPVLQRHAYDPWPTGLTPEITDVDVGIARTDPGYVTGQPIEEIRVLYTDAIRHAKHALYLENQYFSSSVVGTALAERLSAPDAPEVVVVSRLTEEGWLETQTMGALRARLHQRLQQAAAPNHYRLLYPRVPGLDPSALLNVHSKVLVMDDELLSVGSANFNNRSMGFDTECNIAIEAQGDARIARAIAGLRDRLLAEHLGTSPEAVSAEIARQERRLVHAVEALRHEGRTLEPIDPVVEDEIDRLLPAAALVDPERPASAEELAREFVPPEGRRPVAERIAGFVATLLLLAVLAAALDWTPLSDVVGVGETVTTAREMAREPGATVVVLAIYAAAGLLPFPITVLVIATAIVFGLWPAILYAFVGTLLNALVSYELGRWLGRDTIRRFAGSPLNRITCRLARKGVWAIASLRVLPVASFWRVNIVAGASRLRQREFLLGTAIGVAPPIAVTVLFIDRAHAVITDPGLLTLIMAAPLAVLLIASAVFGSRIDDPGASPRPGRRVR